MLLHGKKISPHIKEEQKIYIALYCELEEPTNVTNLKNDWSDKTISF